MFSILLLLFTFTVKAVLSRPYIERKHPPLSGQQPASPLSPQIYCLTVKDTCIQWTPPLSGYGHLET